MRSELRGVIAILTVSLATGWLLSVWQNANATLSIGTHLKDFPGISRWLNSGALTSSSLSGKVVAVDFYTSGCGNCRAAIPHVEKLYEKYKARGFVVVGIHTPEEEYERNIDYVRSTIKELGITYPVAIDDHAATWATYQNQWWPNLLLFDRSGKLVFEHAGEGAYQEIDETVKNLL
jgi:thiol-disulfide isomerase/thioredoxin